MLVRSDILVQLLTNSAFSSYVQMTDKSNLLTALKNVDINEDPQIVYILKATESQCHSPQLGLRHDVK